jgi:hypothetical protein
MVYLITSSIMTRTTLDLDSSVLAQLRRRAREERKSMGQLASERLAASLGQESAAEPPAFEWTTWHMGKPKVDLQDREAVWRVLDSGE